MITKRDVYAAKMKRQLDALNAKIDTLVAEMDKLRDAFTHSFHYFKTQT